MKIKDISTFDLIEILNDFAVKIGVSHSEDMTLIADTLKQTNGSLFIEVFNKAIILFIGGNLDIKTPYRINNRFLSDMINKYFENIRTHHGDYTEEETIRPSQEEINHIFEKGILISKQRVIDFLNNENKFFSPFLLYNEYEWLIEFKQMNPNDFSDSEIHRLTGEFMRHDTLTNKKIEVPEMKQTDYNKAAVVALYLTTI